ncbi:hypothetical protein HDU88_000872, partial [Geranomyces variabilis]
MPAPPLPADLEVSISSFHMLCERLSNIEENIAVLTNDARHRQMSRYGPLNPKLLGYRFPIERIPNAGTPDVAHHSSAEYNPECMIVSIDYYCDVHTQGFCDANNKDMCLFTTAEILNIQDADLSTHPSPKSLGIPSAQDCLCEEALKRQVESAFNTCAFDECYLLPSLDEDQFTIFLRARDCARQDVNAFLDESLRLFSLRHKVGCVTNVALEDCDIYLLRWHETGMKWLGAAEEERREISDVARSCKVANDCNLKTMREHPRFAQYLSR